MKNEKKDDSIIIGAGVFAILFIVIGIFKFVVNDNGYLFILLGSVSFLYFIYLLKNTNGKFKEIYEDGRHEFISEKASSLSFKILLPVVLVFQFLTNVKEIVITTDITFVIIISSIIIIKVISYLFCEYKY